MDDLNVNGGSYGSRPNQLKESLRVGHFLRVEAHDDVMRLYPSVGKQDSRRLPTRPRDQEARWNASSVYPVKRVGANALAIALQVVGDGIEECRVVFDHEHDSHGSIPSAVANYRRNRSRTTAAATLKVSTMAISTMMPAAAFARKSSWGLTVQL